MSKQNDGGPAYPGIQGMDGYANATPYHSPNGEVGWVNHNQGMSLRDKFAIAALPPLIMSITAADLSKYGEAVYDKVIQGAWGIADAMLKARDEKV